MKLDKSIFELGNWPNQSTWHIVKKDTKLPVCETKDIWIDIIPFCQPISMIKELPVCDNCKKRVIK